MYFSIKTSHTFNEFKEELTKFMRKIKDPNWAYSEVDKTGETEIELNDILNS
jgi:hypothetical protein